MKSLDPFEINKQIHQFDCVEEDNKMVFKIDTSNQEGILEIVGSADRNNTDNLVSINPNLKYLIGFRIKKHTSNDDYLQFGIHAYDKDLKPVNMIPAINKNSFPNSFFHEADSNRIKIEGEYYWFRGIVYPAGTKKNDKYLLYFPTGRALIFNKEVKYIRPYIFLGEGLKSTFNFTDYKIYSL